VWLGLALLSVIAPLIPFRYLQLPDTVPGPVAAGLRYLPVFICLTVVCLWLWQQGTTRWSGWATRLAHVPLGRPVLALLIVGLLSAIGARHPGVSTIKTFYYFITGALLFLSVVDGVRREGAKILLASLLGAGYAVALYGILEFAAGDNRWFGAFYDGANEAYRRLIPDPWFEGRITATIGHPVVLGTYLSLLLPLSLAVTAVATTWVRRIGLAAGTALLAAALLLTFSRGAWLAGAAGIGVFLLSWGIRRALLLPVALALVVAVVLAVGGGSKVVDVGARRLDDAYHSYVLNFGSTTRGAGYGYVSTIAERHPLLGLGTGMYRFTAYDLRRELAIPTPVGVLDTPDNMYLVWLAENGGAGLVASLYVLVSLMQLFWQRSRQHAQCCQRLLAWGFLGACVGFCVDLLTVDALYFPVVRSVFWIAMGLGVVLTSASQGSAVKVQVGSDRG
jgi:O-antigen ligase